MGEKRMSFYSEMVWPMRIKYQNVLDSHSNKFQCKISTLCITQFGI